MLEGAMVALRLAQYLGAAILCGAALFFALCLPRTGEASADRRGWPRPLLLTASAVLALAALLSIPVQAGLLTGDWRSGLAPEALSAVATLMASGQSALIRGGAAILAILLLIARPPSTIVWLGTAGLGVVAAAALAGMGHAAGGEGLLGLIHLVSDAVHACAAALWIGALVAFCGLLAEPEPTSQRVAALHRALQGFSGIGTLAVGALIVTGLINSALLIGRQIGALAATPYGQLLGLKLLLFAAMLALAAANRYRLTPALGGALDSPAPALTALRRSVLIEMLLGAGVLALVAGLGTLPPPGH